MIRVKNLSVNPRLVAALIGARKLGSKSGECRKCVPPEKQYCVTTQGSVHKRYLRAGSCKAQRNSEKESIYKIESRKVLPISAVMQLKALDKLTGRCVPAFASSCLQRRFTHLRRSGSACLRTFLRRSWRELLVACGGDRGQ